MQVSINVIDVEQAPLADVVARVREAAAERGVEVGASELVGLLPEGAVADPALLGLDALTDDARAGAADRAGIARLPLCGVPWVRPILRRWRSRRRRHAGGFRS